MDIFSDKLKNKRLFKELISLSLGIPGGLFVGMLNNELKTSVKLFNQPRDKGKAKIMWKNLSL